MRRTFTPEQIFNKLRDELLNREIFTTMAEVKILIQQWQQEYNHVRPHNALRYRLPFSEVIVPALLLSTLT